MNERIIDFLINNQNNINDLMDYEESENFNDDIVSVIVNKIRASQKSKNVNKNIDIRNYAKDKGVNLYEVSERLGYSHETAFSRVLRHELPEDKKIQIREIIDELSEK